VKSFWTFVSLVALASGGCAGSGPGSTGNPGGAGSSVAGSTGGSSAGSTASGGAGSGAAGTGVAGHQDGGAAGSAAGASGAAGADGGAADGGVIDWTKVTLLSQTGLYSDIAARTLAPDVHAYQPQYALWSDGATKQRWVYLPAGVKINTDDMNFWEYPQGMKLWKEFSRDDGTGKIVLIETRILVKTGVGLNDWFMVAFKWNADHKDAVATPKGEMNVDGTQHDIPSQENCTTCHKAMWDNVLGFSALQLSHNLGGLNLTMAKALNWFTTPPAGDFVLPGTDAEKKALGYLHSNCGICHNERGKAYLTTADLDLWTHLDQIATVPTTRAYLSSVCDVWPVGTDLTANHDKFDPITTCPVDHATGAHIQGQISKVPKRVTPLNPAQSALHELMALRGAAGSMNMSQMPPLASEIPDPTGLGQVDAWINGLPLK
jgi:hypothetical protein